MKTDSKLNPSNLVSAGICGPIEFMGICAIGLTIAVFVLCAIFL